jgi:hypothetical protein
MKSILGERLTTVFPLQGHYALDTPTIAAYRPADLVIEHISELVRIDLPSLLSPVAPSRTVH